MKDQLIGQGSDADVFAWSEGQALKLFSAEMPEKWVHKEAEFSRKAWELGLPVPAVGAVVVQDDRYGLVLERLNGPTMFEALLQRPWSVFTLARTLARLQAAVHNHSVPGYRNLNTEFGGGIQSMPWLSAAQKAHVQQILQHLPAGDRLCHGDLHPLNVLMTPRGPMIIDWITAMRGDPAADVARTAVIVLFADVSVLLSGYRLRLFERLRRLFNETYIRHYLALRPDVTREQIEAWMLPNMAARLGQATEAERTSLLKAIDHQLQTATR